jgi:hypothetical protein
MNYNFLYVNTYNHNESDDGHSDAAVPSRTAAVRCLYPGVPANKGSRCLGSKKLIMTGLVIHLFEQGSDKGAKTAAHVGYESFE